MPNDMDLEELQYAVEACLDPEYDEDTPLSHAIPRGRHTKVHGCDFSYMSSSLFWEGSSPHPDTRTCHADAEPLYAIVRNLGVPFSLWISALHILGDSIIAYHEKTDRTGQLQYYPPAILTFWSGFEATVRYLSELMLLSARDIPQLVEDFLREQERFLDKHGQIKYRDRFQGVLDRYAIVLQYGFGHTVCRGDAYWQGLEKARALRNYYTHVDMQELRAITAEQVMDFMEQVRLGIILPSCQLKRSVFTKVYDAYDIWTNLRELVEPFTEQPSRKDRPVPPMYSVRLPFENVDNERFPNDDEMRATKKDLPANGN